MTNLRFKHYTLASYLAEKQFRRENRNFAVRSSVFLVCVMATIFFVWITDSPSPAKTAYVSAVPPTTYQIHPNPNHEFNNASGDTDTTKQLPLSVWKLALNEALWEWSRALKRSIQPPSLVLGTCGYNVFACTDKGKNKITIVGAMGQGEFQDITQINMKTIMMHEVGHLLGVPHIDGDDLMNSGYRAKVDFPTPAAIALARLAEESK
jgi:hypothetical protein